MNTERIEENASGDSKTQERREEETFLHKTINVTAWMKTKIEDFLKEKEYEVVIFDIDACIMTRMQKVTVYNTVNLKMKDKSGKVHSLDGYVSVNSEYDDLSLKWLVDFIKEREMEALLLFYTEKNEGKTEAKAENNVVMEVQGKKEFGNLKFEIYFCCKSEDLIKFISDPQLRLYWMGPTAEVRSEEVKFENVIMKKIERKDNAVEMEYKWKEWTEFSQVVMKFSQIGDNTRIILSQKHIPIMVIDNVKNHWESRVFQAISTCFGCAIKPM